MRRAGCGGAGVAAGLRLDGSSRRPAEQPHLASTMEVRVAKMHFWQGGNKISIEKKDDTAVLRAPDVESAFRAAEKARVNIGSLKSLGGGLVKLQIRSELDDAMARLRTDHVVHHLYHTAGQPEDEVIITDTFYLKFKPGTGDERIAQILRDDSLEVVRALGEETLLVRVTDATGRNAIKASNAAAEREEVEYAEPNIVHDLSPSSPAPTDPFFRHQWHLAAPEDGPDLVKGADIAVLGAWAVTRGSREVVVAIADDGFDLTHPDLNAPNKIRGRLNIVLRGNSELDVRDDVMPREGDYHGTPCAGVAVAEANGQGTVGVAPGCSLLAVRFPLEQMSDAQLAEMFEKISAKADVVSCSWAVGPTNRPVSSYLHGLIARLARSGGRRGRGLVFCVAAGNNNCPIKEPENQSTYTFRTSEGRIVDYSGPIHRWIAAHPDVITVSASTSLKARAAYSCWGEQVSVCAPSSNFDELERVVVRGRGITTTDNEGTGPRGEYTPGSRYTSRFGGTSSATPTVAGVCALMISANPDLTATQVRQILCQTADKDLVIDSETEVRRPGHFDARGFSLWFGHGKVNATKAVAAAAAMNG
ncbi:MULTISPECIES: S8 family serine peptidase [Sorangium]|uniref:S8 family serine peptidase n=1 Tax=Sorangium TaxID=39643 RepID=UPI003D9C54AB